MKNNENNMVYCDLWDENDGIYISFDELSCEEVCRNIINKLSQVGYSEYKTYEAFYPCNEPSWNNLADVREEVTKVVTELGYEIVWL